MKDRLKEYIEKDEIYQDYKKDGLMNASDFDKFCIQHCKDIEELLEENKNLRSQIEYLRRSVERKEETIAELELERVPYTNEYVEELEKENSELKKQLEEYKYSHSCSFVDTCKNVKIANYKQQQEFIKYMKNIIEELECDDADDEEMRGYLFQRIDTFKEILQKYKEIIGCKDENNL